MRYYDNRELSWLKFNERVLQEAADSQIPLCERLNFLSIYQNNLDEFFMVRVGSLQDQNLADPDLKDSRTGMTPSQQIEEICTKVTQLNHEAVRIWKDLMKMIADTGVEVVRYKQLTKDETERLTLLFQREIAPLTSASIISHRQPFPFLNNKQIYAAASLAGKNGQKKTGIVTIPEGCFPRLVAIPGTNNRFILLEHLVLHEIAHLFSGYEIAEKTLLRVTRSADIDADSLYDEEDDYREFMSGLIRKRKRLSPVRLELSSRLSPESLRTLKKYINAEDGTVFITRMPMNLQYLYQVQDMLRNRTDLFYPKLVPQYPSQFAYGRSIFEQLREKDRLIAYPYESMKPFLAFLQEAANDPDVVSIRIALYRVAHHSKIVESLIEASENGKTVQVMVELKARFDEENNIEYSRRMEQADIQVVYGLDGYKVHSKLCLIMRKGRKQMEYYTQIGTGNYNEKTARLYTDLSLMTSDPEIGKDAAAVFQSLFKGEIPSPVDTLLVSPVSLQKGVVSMIEETIAAQAKGKKAWIGIKINSLTDKTIMEALIRASQAGVHVDLIVRGICCLLPGVPGLTDNIHVISIVGRYLEHSRIYIFDTEDTQKVYIASADFMTRNTLRRVEIGVPIKNDGIRRDIIRMFKVILKDNCNASVLHSDGTYEKVAKQGEAIDSQNLFFHQAYSRTPEKKVQPAHLSLWQRLRGLGKKHEAGTD